MTILAMALVALFDAQARGVRAAGAADNYVRARLLAQALLADTVTGWSAAGLAPSTGRDGAFAWSIDVAPAEAGWATNPTEKNSWRLNRVRVTVAWDRERRVVLDTLKLGRVEANE